MNLAEFQTETSLRSEPIFEALNLWVSADSQTSRNKLVAQKAAEMMVEKDVFKPVSEMRSED